MLNKKEFIVDHKEMEQRRLEQAMKTQRRIQKKNNHVTSEWLSGLQGLDYNAMTDINDCLEHIEQLDGNDKNISARIMSSEELEDWFQDTESSFLVADLQTPPRDLNNPLSITSALLAISLRSIGKFPALAFFCKHRNNYSPDEKDSGPIAMLNSLNGQLLEFMNNNRPGVNISLLKDETFFSKSRKKLADGFSLFAALLSLLPKGDSVFIILDSLSCLSGEENEGHKLVKGLNRIMKFLKLQGAVSIRVFVTDPLADSPLIKISQWQLHVPDIVSGADTVDIHEVNRRICKELEDGRDHRDSSSKEDTEGSGEDEDEEDSDSSSDEEDDEDDNSDTGSED